MNFSKFWGKCCKFVMLGIVGSRTVWGTTCRHFSLNDLSHGLSFQSVSFFSISDTVKLFIMLKRNTSIPPEHLQVHIQDHLHLSLNNATGIPPTISQKTVRPCFSISGFPPVIYRPGGPLGFSSAPANNANNVRNNFHATCHGERVKKRASPAVS